MERIFPDLENDGQFQNPKSEKIFDFYEVMNKDEPLKFLSENAAYYPSGVTAEDSDFFIFISGLGQVAKL